MTIKFFIGENSTTRPSTQVFTDPGSVTNSFPTSEATVVAANPPTTGNIAGKIFESLSLQS